MTTHPVGREWVKPGAKVAIYQVGWSSGTVTAYDVIDRVLKRDIVLKSGRRFYFPGEYSNDPIEMGTASNYGTTCLLPADDVRVRDAMAAGRERKRRTAVDLAHLAWGRKPTLETADTLIRAIEAWKDIQ